MTEKHKRSRHGCLWAIAICVVLMGFAGLLVVGGIYAVTRSVHVPSFARSYGYDEFPRMTEVWSEGSGQTKVIRIPLRGMIMLDTQDGLFGGVAGSADVALRAIRRATLDRDVKAIILDIDSGGGGITASDIIYKALVDFRGAQTGRCVVAVFNDLAASGAYYVSLAADRIVAHPTAVTGSIGVLMQSLNVKELAQKIGIRDVTIKSGDNKDMLNPFHELDPKQLELLQAIVNDMHSRFVKLVAENRGLPEAKVREFADGRIFTADSARELGLVDSIGYWSDALAATGELLGTRSLKVYRYEEEVSLASLLKGVNEGNPMSSMLHLLSRTRLYYMWQP
jgi:protease IV